MQQACLASGRVLRWQGSWNSAVLESRSMGTPGTFLFGSVALLTFAAPFELTEPLVRLPRQSITSLEAAILVSFAAWGAVVVTSRRLPQWDTPLTSPWLALIAAMIVASAASPISRVNALHMTGRLAAALGVYLL